MSDDATGTLPMSGSLQCRGNGIRRLIDAVLISTITERIGGDMAGRLQLTLPSGRTAHLGQGGSREASLSIKSYGVLWKTMRRGLLGLAESYLEEAFETESLDDLFALFLDNHAVITAGLPGLARSSYLDQLYHVKRSNTRVGSRQNIAAHYDLGNDFYRLWLDPSMAYSSGIYACEDTPLEAAQAAKYARIINALDLRPDRDVLEIGCGWGGLAEVLARSGARVRGITVSEQQRRAAVERIASAGLVDRVEIAFEDYRDTAGLFDRIVSIEMIEAVGEENWPRYFQTVAERLKPGGSAVIQAITIRDDLFEDYRAKPDFIQRYIFPGGMLPTVAMLKQHGEAAGLGFSEIERFGDSYALTLKDWQTRFDAAWPRIAALGFDERFRRMWDYYLSYCRAGFERGTIDVGLYHFRQP